MPLPPRDEALSLLKDFFENFNCMFPLFHEPTFMHLVNKHYTKDPYEGSGWWASLNIALAIAHRLRVMSNIVPQEEDNKAWAHLKNAMGVLTELTMRNTDLLSVQALLGMVIPKSCPRIKVDAEQQFTGNVPPWHTKSPAVVLSCISSSPPFTQHRSPQAGFRLQSQPG